MGPVRQQPTRGRGVVDEARGVCSGAATCVPQEFSGAQLGCRWTDTSRRSVAPEHLSVLALSEFRTLCRHCPLQRFCWL